MNIVRLDLINKRSSNIISMFFLQARGPSQLSRAKMLYKFLNLLLIYRVALKLTTRKDSKVNV